MNIIVAGVLGMNLLNVWICIRSMWLALELGMFRTGCYRGMRVRIAVSSPARHILNNQIHKWINE